ncbi:MAG: ABC transporter substrate-binding protein [Chloroflexi bacterium]|nr:ABC transporter substrate-binding protein [Chloroflexota bacterium]
MLWLAASFLLVIVGVLALVACGKEEKAAGPAAKATVAPTAKATPVPRLQSEDFKRLPQKIQDAWTKWHPDNLKRPDPYKPIYGGIARRTGSVNMGKNFIKANQPSGATIWNFVSVGLIRDKRSWGEDIANPTPEPDVAESWSSNKDGTEWTFKIRDNVYFQDLPPVKGRKLTAKDVKWWLDTLRAEAYFAGELAEITSVDAPDDRTVVIKTSKPVPDMLNMLAYWQTAIFPKECWDDEKNCMENMPVGVGAFQIKEHTEQRVTMVRNPKYHLKDFAGNPLPYLDGIEIIVVPDAAAAEAAWRTGQTDYYFQTNFTKVETFVKENPGVKVEMDGPTQAAFLSGMAVIFNFKNQGPWQDKRVRQALSLAINRERICEIANFGMCLVPFPVSYVELGRSFEFSWGDLPETMKYNPTKAKQLLADAGYPNGFNLDIQTDLTYDNVWLEVFKDWDAIGVKAKQDKQQDLYLNASKRTFPAAQGTRSTPIGTRGKLYTWAMLHSTAPGNVESYNDPEMDKVLDDWRYSAIGSDQRKQLSQQLFSMVSDRLPRIEIWDFTRYEVQQPWLYNLACGSSAACVTEGVRSWAKVWIDPSQGLPAARKFDPRSAP